MHHPAPHPSMILFAIGLGLMIGAILWGLAALRSDKRDAAYAALLTEAAKRGEPPDYCGVFEIIGHTEHSARACRRPQS